MEFKFKFGDRVQLDKAGLNNTANDDYCGIMSKNEEDYN